MNLNALINRFFGRDDADTSKSIAKERLRLVLVHDRLDISEQTMNALRVDLLSVISKYFGIEDRELEVTFSREADGVALIANIPVRKQNPLAYATSETLEQESVNEEKTSTKTLKQDT
ncbi:MAG: cell division topological specificity factor MinE [Firmicutes bacterium]|nr:cell division topological specificity factor MinE [Bacillota bacterium]